MAEHHAPEVVTNVTLPRGAVGDFILPHRDRRTMIELNTVEVTSGPIYYLFSDAEPSGVAEMRQVPAGGVLVRDATGVNPNKLWVLAIGAVGLLKIVEAS